MKRNKSVLAIIPVLVIVILLIFSQKKVHVEAERRIDRSTSHIRYSKHARCRMECRHIDESEVEEIIRDGRINQSKSEPDSRPDPKFALEGVTHDGQHVRVVIAKAPNSTVVVTVIDLDTDWTCHCD